jgi:hypothetical protein
LGTLREGCGGTVWSTQFIAAKSLVKALGNVVHTASEVAWQAQDPAYREQEAALVQVMVTECRQLLGSTVMME